MSDLIQECGIFTPCHQSDCTECARRRVDRVLCSALSKCDPKWWQASAGPCDEHSQERCKACMTGKLTDFRRWLDATVADVTNAARRTPAELLRQGGAS